MMRDGKGLNHCINERTANKENRKSVRAKKSAQGWGITPTRELQATYFIDEYGLGCPRRARDRNASKGKSLFRDEVLPHCYPRGIKRGEWLLYPTCQIADRVANRLSTPYNPRRKDSPNRKSPCRKSRCEPFACTRFAGADPAT